MTSRNQKTIGKRQMKERRSQTEALSRLLQNYGSEPIAQAAADAPTDSQLNTLLTTLEQELSRFSTGSIIDIGCGNAVLLTRISNLDQFKSHPDVVYLGIDHSQYHHGILQLALDCGIHRRVDVATLEEYDSVWADASRIPPPYIAVVRNVLHELGIDSTTTLLHTLCRRVQTDTLLFIQDLLVFPEAERGNACWHPQFLTELIRECGFRIEAATPIATTSGNRWINIVARRDNTQSLDLSGIRNLVLKYRTKQWKEWATLQTLPKEDTAHRIKKIALVDFDLQFAALTFQLREAAQPGIPDLTQEQESVFACENFSKQILSFRERPVPRIVNLDPVKHFKDRANSLDALQSFLSGCNSVTVITGPPLMGKSTLVKQVLATFEHKRIPCFLDLQSTTTIWNIIENLFSNMGCLIANQVLLRMKQLNFSTIEPEVREFLSANAGKYVFVFDHWERIIEPDGCLNDQEIKDLLQILAGVKGSKVILTSRLEFDTTFLSEYLAPIFQPPVGRFPREPHHVPNVLGAFLGWPSYPQRLIDSIDRHPMMAVLAALYLKERSEEAAHENEFIEELGAHLRSAVFERIVNDLSRRSVEVLSRLRLPISRDMLVSLSSMESVREAERLGLIYTFPDRRREDLLALLATLRLRENADEDFSSAESGDSTLGVPDDVPDVEQEFHESAAREYENEYRRDPDPRWLREMYYHLMLAGKDDAIRCFGNTFCSELSAGAEYWFRVNRDYKRALWAFERILNFGYDKAHIRMRIASCKIRLNRIAEGEAEFEELLQQYPRAWGFASAYVDALLSARNYEKALGKLTTLKQLESPTAWTAGQLGRAHRGLQQHEDAIRAFEKQLAMSKEPVVFQHLASAYHARGDTEKERQVLERGLHRWRNSARLSISYAAVLERVDEAQEAVRILERIYDRNNYSGWVILPLVKALYRLGRFDEVESVWRTARDKVRPDNMNVTIEAEIYAQKGEFATAISLLRRVVHDDEHSGGQRLDLYYRWASSLEDRSEMRQKAKEGLNEHISDAAGNNVPLLVSKAKLAILAEEPRTAKEILEQIRGLNSQLSELWRLEEEYARQFPEDQN